MTLPEFLLARIAEDEHVARAAADDHPPPWTHEPVREDNEDDEDWAFRFKMWQGQDDGEVSNADGRIVAYDEGTLRRRAATHIARHDPARVLAECEAKRRIVDMHADACLARDHWETPDAGNDPAAALNLSYRVEAITDALRLLALPYAGHPDYRQEWTP